MKIHVVAIVSILGVDVSCFVCQTASESVEFACPWAKTLAMGQSFVGNGRCHLELS